MVSKPASAIGLTVSVVVLLAIVISFNWACFYDETTERVVPTYKTMENRDQASRMLTNSTVERWGTVPGQFNSSYYTTVDIINFDPLLLKVENIAKMAKSKRNGENVEQDLSELKNGADHIVYNISKSSRMEILSETDATMTYRPLSVYDLQSVPLDDTVFSLNFDALGLWW